MESNEKSEEREEFIHDLTKGDQKYFEPMLEDLTQGIYEFLERYSDSRDEEYRLQFGKMDKEKFLKEFKEEVDGRFLIGVAVSEGVSDYCESSGLEEIYIEKEGSSETLSNATLFRFFRSDDFYSDVITHCGDDKLSVILDEKEKLYFSGKVHEEGLEGLSEEYEGARFACSDYLNRIRRVLEENVFRTKCAEEDRECLLCSVFDDSSPVEVSGEGLVDGKRILYEMKADDIKVQKQGKVIEEILNPLY